MRDMTYNLRSADDTFLLRENKEDVQQLLDIVEGRSRNKGLKLNTKKTKVMVFSRNKECTEIKNFINGNKRSKKIN